MKHSPKPWLIAEKIIYYKDQEGENWNICTMEPWRERGPDAALILAAADMLEALEGCERLLTALWNDGTLGDDINLTETRTAIAKAKGVNS